MPQHRRSERLPERLLEKIKASERDPFFGHILTVGGGGLTGHRVGLIRPNPHTGEKPKVGTPIDVQYTLKDHILTRTEFLRDELAAIPLHMAHFDPETGKRFSVVLDSY